MKMKICAASAMMMLSLAASAQVSLYSVKGTGKFNRSTTEYKLNEGDSLEFKKLYVAVNRADGSTTKKLTYSFADYYTFNKPEIGLYKPSYLSSNDFDDESSQYCFKRSMESEHFIVFWESGFGDDPTQAPQSSLRFDPKLMLERAEEIFKVHTEQLGFSKPGESKTLDNYKIMMFAHYTTTWMAYGSGQDDKVGTLDVNPAAINSKTTLAHEIGHTFQYIISCDYGLTHGWRYGFGSNASGGCAWWESCAQWQSYKVYPDYKFRDGYSSSAMSYSYLNLLHEYWRYSNYFVQDWWCQLHGEDFIGRLWKESTKPEDPVEAYKRITDESQDDFSRDMFQYAQHAITWDIDAIKAYGKNSQDNFSLSMHRKQGGYEVDSAYCPQNYGFNVLKLKAPAAGTVVKATFTGEAGADGYRAVNTDKAGWRYGFVAQKTDGTCVYGDMYKDSEGEATFTVPENVKKLWFVVLGAPTEHWRHPWDMTDDKFEASNLADDEQWPYMVKFENTDYSGKLTASTYTFDDDYQRYDTTLVYDFEMSKSEKLFSANANMNDETVCMALGLNVSDFKTLSPRSQSDTLYVKAILNDGTETDSLSSAYSYTWSYNRDGEIIKSFASGSFTYYAMWSPYYNMVYAGVDESNVNVGDTFSPKFVIAYKAKDEKVYRVTVVLNIKVVE